MPVRNMVLSGLFAALLAVSSQISFPVGPVPHTLQIVFVLLAGIVLGSRWGITAVAVWILLGAFGLPVFAQGKAGIANIAGPTGGFMAGFAVCAYVVGWITERGQLTLARTAAAMYLGLVLVYIIGLAGFMASFAWFLHKPMTLERALSLSVLPFMPFDAIKTIFAAWLGVRVKRALYKAGMITGQ